MENMYDFKVVKMLPYSRVPKKKRDRNRTTESYRLELIFKGIPLICLDEYVDAKTKILHKCITCGYKYFTNPNNVLSGKWCPKCAHNALGFSKRTSEKDYCDKLIKKGKPYILLRDYVKMSQKAWHLCLICGFEFYALPANLLSKDGGCPNCKRLKLSKIHTYSNSDYIALLLSKKSMVLPLEEYKGINEKILHMDMECKHIFLMSPSNALRGERCAKCAFIRNGEKIRYTHEQYLSELKNRNIPVIPLEEYITATTKILHRYPCGHEYLTRPDYVLHGNGCIFCAHEKLSQNRLWTDEQFKEKLFSVNPFIKVLGEYHGANKRIECQCLICNNIWNPIPSSILNGCGCPICKVSDGERKILKFLNANNIPYIYEKTYDDLIGIGGGLLSYDFHIIGRNLNIEFQGEQHFRSVEYFGGEKQFKIQQEHDKRKRKYAKEHGIDLLEIWYYDYDNIEEILTNYLNLESVETVIPA